MVSDLISNRLMHPYDATPVGLLIVVKDQLPLTASREVCASDHHDGKWKEAQSIHC